MNTAPPPEIDLEHAVGHHRAGRLAEAETSYRRVLAAVPHHPDALHLLGVLRTQMGDPAAGVELIGEAIARREGVAVYWSNLGLACKAAARHADAVTAFANAFRLGGGVPALIALAGVRRMDGNPRAALAIARLAAALDPHGFAAMESVAHATADIDADAAPRPYFRAWRLNPGSAMAAHNLGCARQKAGRADAVEAYRHALAADPAHAAAMSNLGLALMPSDGAASAAWLGRVTRLRPDDPQDHFHLAEASRAAGRADDACAAYKRTAALRPGDYTSWENAALIDADARRWRALETHATGIMMSARTGRMFWKTPVYIGMRIASEFSVAGRMEDAEQVLDRFAGVSKRFKPDLAPWFAFLRASLLLRIGGDRAAEGRDALRALEPALPFLRHVTHGDAFDAVCAEVSDVDRATYDATLKLGPAAEGEGPLVYAGCDGRYFDLFAEPLLTTLDVFSSPGQRVHIHVVDGGDDLDGRVAALNARMVHCRLAISRETLPPGLDPDFRRTYFTCVRLMRAPAVLAHYGDPPLVMIDVDALVLVDPREVVARLHPHEDAVVIHRPESLDYLYNTISNALVVFRAGPVARDVLERTATFLLRWFVRRDMAYFLDQIALIQGFDARGRHSTPIGIVRIKELGRRLAHGPFFLPFLDEKHRDEFETWIARKTAELHALLSGAPIVDAGLRRAIAALIGR